MFTGLVEEVGRITGAVAERSADGSGSSAAPSPHSAPSLARRFTVAARLAATEMALGESLAVDGVCLTVVRWAPGEVDLVAAAETLERTTLGALSVGDAVNLERPLRLGDRLGGHMVAGHVDATGAIRALGHRGAALDVTIAAAPDVLRYVVEKGSIAVDGISLTVNAVDAETFAVSIIPHTQTATTLGRKPVAARVNLEVDLIGKYVEKLVAPHAAASARDGGRGTSREQQGV